MYKNNCKDECLKKALPKTIYVHRPRQKLNFHKCSDNH